MTDPHCAALVRDFQAEGRLVYMKDIDLDTEGKPVILVVTSNDYKPGPFGEPRIWTIAHWAGNQWAFYQLPDQRTTAIWDRYTLILERNHRMPVCLACGDWLPQLNQDHNTGERVAKWSSGLAGTRADIGKWKNN